MPALSSFDSVRDLEAFLGSPSMPAGPLTYGQAVADDRDERFPRASLNALHAWGYSDFQVPDVLGGRLTSLEELVALGRAVARRDPTVAVIANAPVAAAMPVWLAGTPTQQREVGEALLAGRSIALALTEEEHGADLLASEVTAHRTEAGYVVNGTKWPINNVRLARFVCLLVRDPEHEGLRSLSLLLVDLEALASSSYELLPRIRTHGACGADIAGIRFRDARVPLAACIGKPGRGLDLTAQSLIVTRTLVPGLSLGVLDTALACTIDFLRERRLYDGLAIDIPFVQDELAAAYLDLAVAEVVTGCCVRILHLLPDLASVSSAVAKYVVPHLAEKRMRGLSTLLGARYFLREGHWFGFFEKLVRDVRLFSLFDGSEPVVLSALAAQASCLTEQRTDPRCADDLFRSGAVVSTPSFGSRPFATVADEDPVTAGLQEVCTDLAQRAATDRGLVDALTLLRSSADDLLRQAGRAVDPRSEAGQRLGERYARLFAGACLVRTWLGEPDDRNRAVPSPWLAAGLSTLLRPGARMPRATSRSLFRQLME
jgi:alkylation response protein AidB-like acyl-CoA dehydrogenase